MNSHSCQEVSRSRHCSRGLRFRSCQVSNSEVRITFVSEPLDVFVPPDIFLATTVCLMILSAGLLSDLTLGNLIKTNSSGIKVTALEARVDIGISFFTQGIHTAFSFCSNSFCFLSRSSVCSFIGRLVSGPLYAFAFS